MLLKRILFCACLLMISQSLSSQSIHVKRVNLDSVFYTCVDSLTLDRIIDSTIKLMELREVLTAKNKTIYSLIDEYNESRNEIIRYKEIVALQNEKEYLYKEHEARLEKKIKRTKFVHKFSATLGIIGAGIGGYLIGKQ